MALRVITMKGYFKTYPCLNRDYNKEPNIKALDRRGFTNHGFTLSPSPKP